MDITASQRDLIIELAKLDPITYAVGYNNEAGRAIGLRFFSASWQLQIGVNSGQAWTFAGTALVKAKKNMDLCLNTLRGTPITSDLLKKTVSVIPELEGESFQIAIETLRNSAAWCEDRDLYARDCKVTQSVFFNDGDIYATNNHAIYHKHDEKIGRFCLAAHTLTAFSRFLNRQKWLSNSLKKECLIKRLGSDFVMLAHSSSNTVLYLPDISSCLPLPFDDAIKRFADVIEFTVRNLDPVFLFTEGKGLYNLLASKSGFLENRIKIEPASSYGTNIKISALALGNGHVLGQLGQEQEGRIKQAVGFSADYLRLIDDTLGNMTYWISHDQSGPNWFQNDLENIYLMPIKIK